MTQPIIDAIAAAKAAPLSRIKAMEAARAVVAELADGAPALLSALVAGGAELVIDSVAVPIEDYPKLSEADFMVSVYNGLTVQRVRIVARDGTRHDVHEVLAQAVRI